MSEMETQKRSTVTISNLEVAISQQPEFQDPLTDSPPIGVDLLLLTCGGVLVRGQWKPGNAYLAWCPLPKTPAWLKARLSEAYFQKLEAK